MTTNDASRRYTQNDEEDVILRVLAGIENGLVIDVGAYDGVTFSNSRRLIEMGWRAVLVEPEPSACTALRRLYAEHPRVQIIEAALGRSCGKTELLVAHQTPDHHGLYTTTDAREAEIATARHGTRFEEITCPTIDWSALLERAGHDVSFISIDAEGTSIDLLLDLDLSALASLRLLCVERDFYRSGFPDEEAHRRAVRFAANHYFALMHETAENLLFARCG